MKQHILPVAVLAVFTALGAWAQTEPGPEFEAASIKPAPPPTGNGMRVMMRGGPGSDDPGRLDWDNVSLRNMLTNAFNIKDYQLQGPDWMNTERFIVAAKIAPNTTKEQYRLMLQKLLAERFHMTFHHEEREHAVFALTVAKGGPKLKESDPNDTSGFGPMMGRGGEVQGRAMPPPPPPPRGATLGRGGMMRMMPGHLEAKHNSIDSLANMLSNLVGKPVIDQTGLKGIYDFTLEYAPDSVEGGPQFAGGGPPPGAPGGEGRAPAAADPGATVYAAVQQQLGLKLESKKLPLDNVVIDHIEKVPTEN
ncbi:MAG TPA: TIGR03435 family protein [Candidatus Sulfopaludibacter sp.]|jgi:uncharacterized protein (TIGR03435 family)|nr:TIGR03435 family protein [Candidatus Sulfopaludibacter sp.]